MSRDPVDLAGLEEDAAAHAEAERVEQEAIDSDFIWLMSNKRGRRLMWAWLEVAGVFRNPFVIGDQSLTAFRCGEMNVGQQLNANIQRLCPEHFHTMITEHNDATRRRTRTSDN